MTRLGLLDMWRGFDFIAVDVETANADLSSICQIGIAGFSHGSVEFEWKTLVDPQTDFSGFNISIHAITPDMVKGAPIFSDLADQIEEAFRAMIVASHTAFDRTALRKAMSASGRAWPENTLWLDSACVARRTWPEVSRSGYGLAPVCRMLGYSFAHHDALEDAKACGTVILRAMTVAGMTLDQIRERSLMPITPGSDEPIRRYGNPEGDLFGEVLVFTGALGIARSTAADFAAYVGCEVRDSVTNKTTVLVVGEQDINKLAGHDKSSKQRKAEALIKAGRPIRILHERDFIALAQHAGASLQP